MFPRYGVLKVLIDCFHNGDGILSLSNHRAMGKIQMNIWSQVRAGGLISINTKE